MHERPGLAALLPAELACAETHGDSRPHSDGGPRGADGAAVEAGLAEERAAIAHAAPKRRAEYLAVRDCARRALADLGRPPVAIPTGPKREPIWPPGVVGSLTHCAGYRAAAVARAGGTYSVGIDAEPNEPLPPGVLDEVTSAAERAHLAGLPDTGAHWDRLLFSAKESVYKAWYPLAGRWLGFEDAEVWFDPDGGGWQARLLVPGPVVDGRELTGLAGRWRVHRGLALTAVTVRPPAWPARAR